jgi:hypothetical protein
MRTCAIALYFFLFGLVQIALSDFCVNTGNPCSSLKVTEIVFLGHVIAIDESAGDRVSARMAVEKVLHGLPEDIQEIDVYLGSYGYMLKLNERYVIYGRHGEKHNQIFPDVCSFTFNVKGSESLLKALLQEEAGGPSILVGNIWKKGGRIPGLKVIAEGKKRTFETYADESGQFEFQSIIPDSYKVRIESEDYFQTDLVEWERISEVGPGRCATKTIYATINGQISGTVHDRKGMPLSGVSVEAYVSDENSELDSDSKRKAITDAEGKYTLKGLENGHYAVGVNGDEYEDKSPYPPAFYPDSKGREHAGTISLSEFERKTGVDLVLEKPRAQTVLIISAYDEKGASVPEFNLRITNSAGVERYHFNMDKNAPIPLKIRVYQGENYCLELSIEETGKKPDGGCCMIRRWIGKQELLNLNTPELPIHVTLHERKPIYD